MLSIDLVFEGVRLGGDHVDDSRLALLSRRARSGRGVTLLGSSAFGVLLESLEFAVLF